MLRLVTSCLLLLAASPLFAGEWITLFDGTEESLNSNWVGYEHPEFSGHWVVDNGTIHFPGKGNVPGTQQLNLATKQQFGDFELSFEWKISEAGNSGIIYRSRPGDKKPYMTGPEYQVLDNAGHPDGKQGEDRQASALYDIVPPAEDYTKPVGEWNTGKIIFKGDHLEHWLNGHKTVDADLNSHEYKDLLAGSKFKMQADRWPDFFTQDKGVIALQDHNDPVWYRNIKVKSLD
ncbi:3-keto-disaccharide hydrolase [Calycomorphotria hydatis]|uniref:3-keto-alpha-glucoside-1,2-lyase/3-keto-2-hydroxy-glucal hydratase domain-containing protein n=1 Tax=Calycomorphotria hydatis TaxID=2528027 RepID=A0A517T358_9PLAN|nr:DUF1080 domain-containing protein [Calycomorphotria hydatis]QDT62813.1 hypothetical protein V22_00110 [Calycomorphotria hydatis]